MAGPRGGSPKEETGPERWLIDGSDTTEWTTVEAAIRYVTEMRDHATDPLIKKNADRTLAMLNRIH